MEKTVFFIDGGYLSFISKYFGVVTLAIAIPITVYYYGRCSKRMKVSEKPLMGEAKV